MTINTHERERRTQGCVKIKGGVNLTVKNFSVLYSKDVQGRLLGVLLVSIVVIVVS